MSNEATGQLSLLNEFLPAEVFSDILLWCTYGPMDHEHAVKTPLVLSWVCKRWREAALSTPQLWRRLWIRLISSEVTFSTSKASAWMERSSGCALSIMVFWDEQTTLTSHPALDTLIQHSARWIDFFAYLPSLCALAAFRAVRENLPMLQQLSLGSDNFLHSEPWHAFEVAPTLRSFECINIAPFQIQLPWNQLRSLPMVSLSTQECLEMLHRCPNLEAATFIIIFHHSLRGSYPLRSVQNNLLQSLTFTPSPGAAFVDLNPVLERMSCPNLLRLQLCDFLLAPLPPLYSFLSRSGGKLQTLIIRRVTISETELIECLTCVPGITRLEIMEEPGATLMPLFGDSLLQRLKHDPGQQDESRCLVPKLEDLTVVRTGGTDAVDSYLDIVESRVRQDTSPSAVARLKSAILGIMPTSLYSGLNDTQVERRRALRDRGLDISIGDYS